MGGKRTVGSVGNNHVSIDSVYAAVGSGKMICPKCSKYISSLKCYPLRDSFGEEIVGVYFLCPECGDTLLYNDENIVQFFKKME